MEAALWSDMIKSDVEGKLRVRNVFHYSYIKKNGVYNAPLTRYRKKEKKS